MKKQIKIRMADAFSRFLPAKYANLLQCSEKGLFSQYFVSSRHDMEHQWATMIWPLISNFDFTSVLELGPGAGRNTEKLCTVSKRIVAVDFNEYALQECRKALTNACHNCELVFQRNNGKDLRMIASGSISAIYCWDTAVHFERTVFKGYVTEFGRVLKPGGCGFVHHSNLGISASRNFKRNRGWRSNVDKGFVTECCKGAKLGIVAQVEVPWVETVDCATVFVK
jgi:ubiquinone/menaquinone biosynthesis C-methylase UbiE